jgi:hypothetical protein
MSRTVDSRERGTSSQPDPSPPGPFVVGGAVLQLFVLRRGDYGYDAPWFPVLFGFLSIAAGLGATISWREGVIRPAMQMTLYFVFFLANTSSFLYTTRRGKFLEWDRILDRLHLRGDEGVLDMGCGRGAVLTAVKRSKSGWHQLRNHQFWIWCLSTGKPRSRPADSI